MSRCLLIPLILVALFPGTALGRELTIGLPCLNDDCSFPLIEKFFREAYERIGLEVTFEPLPSLLELDFADSGRTDGSLLRSELVAAGYENLVKVPCPLVLIDVEACSLREDIEISRLADLDEYRIGVARGNLTTGRLCAEAKVRPVLLNSLTSGIRMMEEGRLDVILDERLTIDKAMAETGKPLHCSAPLLKVRLYHWLNKRNADLACPLTEVFRAMAAEGDLSRVFGDYAMPPAE